MVEPVTRRRGDALRSEILGAVRDELRDHGYAGVTYDGVARRAHTSKPVLYRRWRSRAHLVLDALTAQLASVTPAPDTGNLRGDLIALLQLMRTRFQTAGAQALRGIVADADADLRSVLLELTDALADEISRTVLQRARERGELGPVPIPPLVSSVPVILFRHDLLLTDEPSDARIEEIVDAVCLPLMHAVSRRPRT
ncbi:MAG: TetR/AcrR family transcriptional regulator [Cellulomonas sp.]|nr:TetR/AcrR family transcriptional regulator [Cellulomonas sp.]